MRDNYEMIIKEAEHGDSLAMYRTANLYDIGVVPDPSGFKSIYWYKRFWESPKVQAAINNYDEKAPDDDRATVFDELYLRDCIIEAGLALGLYYMNSTDPEEACYAYECLCEAYFVSRFRYFTKEELDGKTDINQLLEKQKKWLESLGVDVGARYGI